MSRMLTVEEYGRIRRAHRDGMSIREIAREFHNSRYKVREVLRGEGEPQKFCLRFSPGSSRTGSQLSCYISPADGLRISIGLVPMGSQLSCYGADQPLNRGFPRGKLAIVFEDCEFERDWSSGGTLRVLPASLPEAIC